MCTYAADCYLGREIDLHTVHSKQEAVTATPNAINQQQLHSFLVLINYYGKLKLLNLPSTTQCITKQTFTVSMVETLQLEHGTQMI